MLTQSERNFVKTHKIENPDEQLLGLLCGGSRELGTVYKHLAKYKQIMEGAKSVVRSPGELMDVLELVSKKGLTYIDLIVILNQYKPGDYSMPFSKSEKEG